MKRLLVFITCLLSVASVPSIGRCSVSFDEVFGKEPPAGRMPSRISWAPDGSAFTYVLPSQDNKEALDVRLYDVRTHASRVFLPALKLGMRGRTPLGIVWSPDARHVAYVQGGSLWVADVATGARAERAKDASDPHWSPDGKRIAFNRNEDLYVVAAAGGREKRLTFGGKDGEILNGDTDWVYPEELETPQAFAWSADGKSIAYLRFDERQVTAFPIVDFLETDNAVEPQRYPLAGEHNPRVTLHELTVANRRDRVVYDAGAHDEYLPWFAYQPHSNVLAYEVLDRAQQHVRVVTATGTHTSVLYERHDPAWVDVVPEPIWNSDGSSYWLVSDGQTRSLFFRSATGAMRALTHAMRVQSIERGPGSSVIATAAYPTRRDQALLAYDRDGHRRVLTGDGEFHNATLSPDGSRFVDYRQSANAPIEAALVETDSFARTVLAARKTSLAAAITPTELLSVPSSNGPLDATMIKPPNFDPAKRYPVIVYVYGGPEAPTTQNKFTNLYHQLLAQTGYIVFSIDGPESQIDSEAHLHTIKDNFGPAMLYGQERGATYLASLPYVDPHRIGIWGWSYGGYATVYTLEHSKAFAAGVAVAPVTDWHFYDSIYTERYMGLPKGREAIYDRSSDLLDAKHLAGPLLVNHGTGDDNVHMANSVELMQAFVTGDVSDVDYAVYPRQTHSIAALADRRVLYRRMLDWWQAHMPPG